MENLYFGEYIPLCSGAKENPQKWYDKIFNFLHRFKFFIVSLLLNLVYWAILVYLMKSEYYHIARQFSMLGIPLGLLFGVSIADLFEEIKSNV